MYNLRKDDPRSSYNLCRKSPATGLRSETAITRTMAESPGYCPGNGLWSSLNSQEVCTNYFKSDDPGPFHDNCHMPTTASLRSETLDITQAFRSNECSPVERSCRGREASQEVGEGNFRKDHPGSVNVSRIDNNFGRRWVEKGLDTSYMLLLESQVASEAGEPPSIRGTAPPAISYCHRIMSRQTVEEMS